MRAISGLLAPPVMSFAISGPVFTERSLWVGPFFGEVYGLDLIQRGNAVLMVAEWAGVRIEREASASLRVLLAISLAGFVWRAALRAAFTAREYGLAEGARAVLRIPVANVIAIMAGRRALAAYLRSLRGAPVSWDKTEHRTHPVQVRMAKA